MDSVRLGVIGCGSVLRSYGALLQDLEDHGLVRVLRASDVDASKQDVLRRHFASTAFTTNFHEVISSDDVDLVLVLTSPPDHGRITAAALEAGKHVLVEKPMASTLEEAAHLVELSRDRARLLVCAPHVVLSPTYQIIWKRVLQGEIGDIHLARARYGEGPFPQGKWRYGGPGSGPLFELGVYNITSLTGLLGPAKRVTAMAGIAVPEREVDGERVTAETSDSMQVVIEFEKSGFGVVTTGYTMLDYRSPALELYGSEGVIQMLGDDWAPEGYELWHVGRRTWEIFPEVAPLWHWTDGLRHIVECIQREEEPLITPEHAFHVQEIMVKAQQASVDGQARKVDSTFPPIGFDVANIDLAQRGWHGRPSFWIERQPHQD